MQLLHQQSQTTRRVWVAAASTAVVLVTAVALLTHRSSAAPPTTGPAGPAVASPPDTRPATAPTARRFMLRLGDGFRFRDAAVVGRAAEDADLVFRYLPPVVGGLSTRYNPISKQVETGFEPTLTAAVPVLVSAHAKAFADPPDLARLTSGDVAGFANQAAITAGTRHVLLMTGRGEAFLLTIDDMQAVAGRYDDWRIGLSFEPVRVPLGPAGGPPSTPLAGKLVFRDWYRSKMIERVDLATGRAEQLADGTLPSVVGDQLLGFGDTSGAYVVRDADGKVLHSIRFNERVLGPVLSPDGKRLLGTVYRAGPPRVVGGVTFEGTPTLSVVVFDLEGKEVASVVGYDDATWTPDEKIVATGPLNDPGLYEIDPATAAVRAIDTKVAAPGSPAVSPDGKSIAFTTGQRVWLIDRDGTNLRQLLPDGRPQHHPAFSPDGTKVAMAMANQLGLSGSGEVFVVDVKTRQVTPVRTLAGASVVPDTDGRLSWVP